MHRGAAFVIEGAENIEISQCSFDQPGGNGLLLSDYTRNCSIHSNDFSFSGDSAVVSLGPSFAYSLTVHSFHTRRDRVASLTTCRLHGAAIQNSLTTRARPSPDLAVWLE